MSSREAPLDDHGSAADALGPQGALAQWIRDFAPREAQQRMATAVERNLAEGGTLVVEAGTGVGKTFAYLVPVLQHASRVIISTGTRNLQDQLFHTDLPLVCQALGLNVRRALLKGRGNYVCPHRLNLALADRQNHAGDLGHQLVQVRDWAQRSRSGDIAELTALPEDAPIWSRVTSTVDNCLGQACPEYDVCPLLQARRSAQEADVVVVNHHLLLADMALRQEGFGEVLPTAEAFIIDEAHQLPDVATHFFGTHLGSRQLLELSQDSKAETLREAADMPVLLELAEALSTRVKAMRLSLGEDSARGPWLPLLDWPGVQHSMSDLVAALEALAQALDKVSERGRGLEACAQRARALIDRLALFQAPQEDAVQWYETWTRSFSLHLTPLDVASVFGRQLRDPSKAWVFTSATLAVDGGFRHFSERLGLDQPDTLMLDSPFDYARHARLYLPTHLPEPNEAGHTGAVVEAALPLIRANPGGSFMLFTSLRAMNLAASHLEGNIGSRLLLVQNQAPRQALLEQFRATGDAVLLGAHSFWEGVDVRGMALSLVIIDRLPFAAPGDPVLEARIGVIRAAGGNPFLSLQIPQAVISLKQGAGRLIRDVSDRGVLMIGDNRLKTKSYGRIFLQSLPPMPCIDTQSEAIGFLTSTASTSFPAAPS